MRNVAERVSITERMQTVSGYAPTLTAITTVYRQLMMILAVLTGRSRSNRSFCWGDFGRIKRGVYKKYGG
jgi:hypothetical protein